jgi:hypothetical protein
LLGNINAIDTVELVRVVLVTVGTCRYALRAAMLGGTNEGVVIHRPADFSADDESPRQSMLYLSDNTRVLAGAMEVDRKKLRSE